MLGKVLEVGIGLAFIFLLMALVATALQELFATLVKLRGKYLVQAVSNLLAANDGDCWRARNHLFVQKIRELADPAKDADGRRTGSKIFRKVVSHPLFREVAPKSMPSYVPARNFARALFDALKDDAHLGAELTKLIDALPASPQKNALATVVADMKATLDERIDRMDVAAAGLAASPEQARLRAFLARNALKPQRVFSRIEAGIAALPEGSAKAALATLAAGAGGDLKTLQADVETWFNDSMDRVGGVYKRFTQYFTLVFALAAAVLFNVNAIEVASALWKNDALRESVVAAASKYVNDCVDTPNKPGCPPPEDKGGGDTAGAAEDPTGEDETQPQEPASEDVTAGEPASEGATTPGEPTTPSTPAPLPPPQPEPAPATPSPAPPTPAAEPTAPAPDPSGVTPAPGEGGTSLPPKDSRQTIDEKANAAFDQKKQDLAKTVSAVSAMLDPLSLPIGWGSTPFASCEAKAGTTTPKEGQTEAGQNQKKATDGDARPSSGNQPAETTPVCWSGSWWGSFFASALPGWLITALAVMLGAPFWFDLLKLFLNIRGAGPKPKETPEGTTAQ